ncbi:ferredoxin [Streptacidiphilus sp. EB103A]|uniref:ferredoxin n=1 Tax=Streptacidiphilus sp. EB103A TaxID=3156275 RepID=UPI0035170A38
MFDQDVDTARVTLLDPEPESRLHADVELAVSMCPVGAISVSTKADGPSDGMRRA